MEGERETVAEPETPIIGEVDEATEIDIDVLDDGDEPEQPEGSQEPEQPVDDEEEFDWEGKTIKGPKGLKDAVLRQADYTRKTQEVAEQRRNLEAFQQRLAQQAEVNDAELAVRATLTTIEARLKEYEQADWNGWEDQDPIAAQRGWREYQQLDKQRAQYVNALYEVGQKRTQAAQQDFAKRIEETENWARKTIPNYTPEIDRKVLDFAKSKGIDEGFIRQNMQPLLYEMLYKASEYDRVMSKPASPKPVNKAPVQPTQTVSARSSAPVRKAVGEMTIEEHAALFRKQQAARR